MSKVTVANWRETFHHRHSATCPLCEESISLKYEEVPVVIQSNEVLYLAHKECAEEYAADHHLPVPQALDCEEVL
ncbi:hypothetical protein RYZ26_15400 [Terasakiella sp. A23]|uniref:hypothetical protein n=1 Tax=Terasakiella sp. FCG-A23 TaxID=3080561 RepID=UPI002952F184|nr:hypothetical protein [Terasakiella sp. A23]MDV7340991.1 hypothetical protein [Terasakiella sp. A23]